MKSFESFLAPQLKAFIAYRQYLGYAHKTVLSHLKTFDRYLRKHKVQGASQLLQPAFFIEFRKHLQIESGSINSLFYTLQAFFQFLVRKELYPTNPVQDIPPLPEKAFIPFVFSPEQINQLVDAVCKRIRKCRKHFFKDLSEYLAILFLARCGMRIKEPLRLRPNHYRAGEKTIYIEKTKFKKDRLIPVPKAVAEEIENYLSVRNTLRAEDQNPYLLAGFNHGRLSDNRVRFVFHQAVKSIGIHQPRRIIGTTTFASPTPHSLRHSFAVNTLKSVKERGISPDSALPVLAVYMGHSEYKHTIKYLKIVDAQHRRQWADFAGSHDEDL
ncbi:MAG: tyrosine-type recombinase/integrase [Deltaproteobacteria bacterium]|nr:tyrosine-type recombinase/integrase [Candidatus Desulfobacula maris]